MSDKDDLIVAGVNQKDKGIWRDFYDRYYAALCSYVEKILFLTDAVEDLVQEVFISVWEGKRTFSDSRELTNYLYRACYNNALLYIRNHQIHDSILNGLPQEEDFEDEEMLYALTVKEEAIRQLYFYIEELPAEQRRIILLRIEGHSWDEIASRLGVSINTVKTQKSRSYKFLREKLANSSYSVLLALIFIRNRAMHPCFCGGEVTVMWLI